MRLVALGVLVALLVVAGGSAQPVEVHGKYVVVRSTAAGQNWLELQTFPSPSARLLTPRPVPGERRTECCGSFSPDGSKFLFERATPRVSKLLMLDLGTGALRTIVQLPGSRSWRDVWSQDSRAVLYPLYGQRGGLIRRLNVDGTGETVLSRFRGEGYTWPEGTSPDGSIALVVESYGEPIYFQYEGPDVLHAIGNGAKVELARTDSIGRAEWSPDGTLVAYTADCYSLCRIEVVRPDGTARRRLTRFRSRTSPYGGFDELSFAWSGRSGEIVYGRGRSLYGVDARSGSQRRISTLPCPRRRCEGPRISLVAVSRERDIAFVSVEDVSNGGISDGDEQDPVSLYRVSLSTGTFVAADRLENAVAIWFGETSQGGLQVRH